MDASVVDLARQAIPLLLRVPRFDWSYDEEGDVLYITFDRTAATDAEETDDNIVVRYKDDRIIGLTVLFASTRLPALSAK